MVQHTCHPDDGGFSEMLVNINQTTRQNIPEDSHLQTRMALFQSCSGNWKNIEFEGTFCCQL
jgi:hypothetical protein